MNVKFLVAFVIFFSTTTVYECTDKKYLLCFFLLFLFFNIFCGHMSYYGLLVMFPLRNEELSKRTHRCGSRIWSRGGPASEAESCRCSEAKSHERSEQSVAGVQGPLKGPGSFWVFNAQICIFTHSRDSFSLIFDIYFDTKS